MNPYISILIPIYNVEKYLQQCMESILAQTLSNVQIICINDGSSDGSKHIIENYLHKDERIILLNQKNRGYGAALNYGLTFAEADYVAIVEPDDFLDAKAFELLYETAQQYSYVDIVKFAYWNYSIKEGKELVTASNSSMLELIKEPFLIAQYPQLLLHHPSIWSCLYKSSFLKENHLNFVEAPGAGWTDNPFFIASMCLAKNIVWRNHKVYYYRQGHSTASSNLKDCRIPILRLQEILNFTEEYKIVDFGILICIYKRVFRYIDLVRSHHNYIEKDIEPLIQNILMRLDADIIKSEFFTQQEQKTFLLTGR